MASICAALLAAFLQLYVWAGSEAAARQGFAAIAVDARSGRVLYARNADSPRIPASVTKVMTLYMLFREIRAGRLSLSTRIRISRHAASMQPSKLWLKPGQTITVDQAIRALVTKSANDVAAAVAEAIAGTESAFARRMTATARAMGMTRTTFRNASGLPHPPNVTTARDLATLALRIQRDFPRLYRRYFSLKYFSFRGRRFRNHNHLLWRIRGMDGLKTGYTRAAGFNLAATVRRNGRRVVAVVLGAPSSRARNAYMARLLERMLRRRDLVRGTRIAAVAGTPPGLSRKRMLALAKASARSTTTRRKTSESRVKAATNGGSGIKVLPRSRPAIVAFLASGRHMAETAEQTDDAAADAQDVARTVRPRVRPQHLANKTKVAADATRDGVRNPERADSEIARTDRAPLGGGHGPTTATGKVFTKVRPADRRIAAADTSNGDGASPSPASPVAPVTPEEGRNTEQGRLAMEVRPERPAPASGEANVRPDAIRTRLASADDALPFAPRETAQVVKVDPQRREMVVARRNTTPVLGSLPASGPDISVGTVPSGQEKPSTGNDEEIPAPANGAPSVARGSADEDHASADDARTSMRERNGEAETMNAAITRHLQSWNIQLGAFPAEDGARKRLAEARRAAHALLRGKAAFTMVFRKGGATFYRARFAGFDRRSARRACKALKRRRIPCFALAPAAAGRS